jgi:hypothetical protein
MAGSKALIGGKYYILLVFIFIDLARNSGYMAYVKITLEAL